MSAATGAPTSYLDDGFTPAVVADRRVDHKRIAILYAIVDHRCSSSSAARRRR